MPDSLVPHVPLDSFRHRDVAFPSHFERSVQRIRGAFTELLTGVGADPGVPQAVARRFGVNKNLAWKICKIVNTPDPYQAVQHLPGASGCDILLKALRKGGAEAASIDAVRAALEEFEGMVELHAGDRATLERMLGSMRPERVDPLVLEASRKAAFQGNSAVFGVQARVRSGAHLIAPSREFPGRLDVGILGGLVDFRRLRPTATWPLTQEQHAVDDPEGGPRRVEPIDPDVRPGEPPFVREFCTQPLPDVRSVPASDGTIFELREGPVGNTAALTCAFGWILRGFGSTHATDEDQRGEYFLRLNTPAERAHFDLLVHRDLPFEGAPEFDLYSLMQGRVEIPLTTHTRFLLPHVVTVESLGASPPVLASPHAPRQTELLGVAAARLGCDLAEFRGYRLSLTYPPIPTLAIFHYPLPAPA